MDPAAAPVDLVGSSLNAIKSKAEKRHRKSLSGTSTQSLPSDVTHLSRIELSGKTLTAEVSYHSHESNNHHRHKRRKSLGDVPYLAMSSYSTNHNSHRRSFLDLPAEIRIMIYEYFMDDMIRGPLVCMWPTCTTHGGEDCRCPSLVFLGQSRAALDCLRPELPRLLQDRQRANTAPTSPQLIRLVNDVLRVYSHLTFMRVKSAMVEGACNILMNGGRPYPSISISLLLTNRQISQEAAEVMYKRSLFRFNTQQAQLLCTGQGKKWIFNTLQNIQVEDTVWMPPSTNSSNNAQGPLLQDVLSRLQHGRGMKRIELGFGGVYTSLGFNPRKMEQFQKEVFEQPLEARTSRRESSLSRLQTGKVELKEIVVPSGSGVPAQ